MREDRLFIHILASRRSPALVGRALECITLDVSASGIKMATEVAIPLHTEIDLWIDVTASAQKYYMHGLVRWCDLLNEPELDEQYQIGVQLLNIPFTDFESWRQLFEGIESVSHLFPRV